MQLTTLLDYFFLCLQELVENCFEFQFEYQLAQDLMISKFVYNLDILENLYQLYLLHQIMLQMTI